MDPINKVKEFVIDNYLYGDDSRLKEDTSFLAHGIIDSTGVVELVSFLQETFNISVADDEMIPENLDSLKHIEQFLKRKLNGTVQDLGGHS
jgi:acyl carrier protein